MITNIGVVVSALVSVGALAVSFIAHRHQVDRARVLDARERRLEDAERLLAQRQALTDRQAVLAQASMIDARVVWTPSSLVDGLTTPELKITNRSSQPVSALSAWIADESVAGMSGGLAAASSRTFPLSPVLATDADTEPDDLYVAFTDAAGIRWRREGSGGLSQGTRTLTEGGVHEWV